jgi:SAM-dependent methyltransferase
LAGRSQDRKVSLILPWAGSGGIVDLGCGAGGFLAAWRRARPGEPALGLEGDAAAADLARSRGLDIVESDLAGALPPAAGGGSLYTLWHVLEHLDDPAGVLTAIREIMDPDGHIVLAVPNAAGLERSFFRSRTIAWDPPRHRWHFTPEGLTALSRLTGLEVRDRFNLLSDDIYDAVTSLQWALYPRFWVEKRPLRTPATTVLALLGGVPLGLGLALVAPWRGRASLGVVLGR